MRERLSENTKGEQVRLDTKLVHTGEDKVRSWGAVAPPIYQTATFSSQPGESYDEIRYARLNNTPNHNALHEKIASIANGEACVVTSSGMAAISTALLTVLKSGDHVLVQDCLYGGTHSLLVEDLRDGGISFSTIDGRDPGSWDAVLTPDTKAIYVESISNPTLDVACLEEVAKFAAANGLVSLIDNTFCSPVNFRPLEVGYDIELHSATKYLNGHSDIVAGCAIGNEDMIRRITRRLNHLGGCLDPHACFLLHRGMKTLSLRVTRQNENGLALARHLTSHPGIERVIYPGLESHQDFDRASTLFSGFGGVLSFEVAGDVAAADRLIAELKLPMFAPSLGGVETLITRPVLTTHSGLTPDERETAGISDRLIRIAVGVEASEDLCEDFDQALVKIL
jgi:cystathionine beta-lyase/cystathionine gamma-synthase